MGLPPLDTFTLGSHLPLPPPTTCWDACPLPAPQLLGWPSLTPQPHTGAWVRQHPTPTYLPPPLTVLQLHPALPLPWVPSPQTHTHCPTQDRQSTTFPLPLHVCRTFAHIHTSHCRTGKLRAGWLRIPVAPGMRPFTLGCVNLGSRCQARVPRVPTISWVLHTDSQAFHPAFPPFTYYQRGQPTPHHSIRTAEPL